MTSLTYTEFQPCRPLGFFVKCFWQLEGSANIDPGPPERILPDGCSELIFNFADPLTRFDGIRKLTRSPRTYFVGQTLRPVCVIPQGKIDLFGVSFLPAGAYPFIRLPQTELTGRIVGLDLIWGRSFVDVEQQIIAATSRSLRISIMEKYLLACLGAGQSFNNYAVAEAVRRIVQTGGQLRMDRLAETLSISLRRLQKEFALKVGISPKSLARIIRFQNVFRNVDNCHGFDWANAVVAGGYFDQSHLIKDFQFFCGQSPARYFEGSHNLAEHFRSVNRGAHSYNTICAS
ncbi:MAG: AraC family transcriptional regulator [Planctomycetes bacterium]|nr:AraC family transcriptional regulator [Planctomycetota bacterium]